MYIVILNMYNDVKSCINYNNCKPILLYGSEIWGFSKNIDCLEKYNYEFVN